MTAVTNRYDGYMSDPNDRVQYMNRGQQTLLGNPYTPSQRYPERTQQTAQVQQQIKIPYATSDISSVRQC